MSEEIETKAREMGWVEQEAWKGPPEKWRPAEEFVERGENILPIIKDRLSKVEDELRMAIKVNKSIEAKAYERAKKEHAAELETIRKEKFEAVQAGDSDTYVKLENKEKSLVPPEPVVEPPVESPVFIDWKGKNAWYLEDQDLKELAEFTAAKINKESPGMEERAFYEAVAGKVKTIRPDKFANPNRDKVDIVEGGGARSSRGKKTFADLPKSAQDTFHRLKIKIERTPGAKFEKETYAKEYFEE